MEIAVIFILHVFEREGLPDASENHCKIQCFQAGHAEISIISTNDEHHCKLEEKPSGSSLN